jgi:cytochrome c-type biogenesis protein CcmH/NrfG
MATVEQILSEILRGQRAQAVTLGEVLSDVRQIKERQLDHEKRDEDRFAKLEKRDAELEDDVEEITGQHKAVERADDVIEKRTARAKADARDRRAVWLPIVVAIIGSVTGTAALATLAHLAWR